MAGGPNPRTSPKVLWLQFSDDKVLRETHYVDDPDMEDKSVGCTMC